MSNRRKSVFAVTLAVALAAFMGASCAPAATVSLASANASQPEPKEPEVDLDELPQGLLYKGLPKKYVDMSWLGPHDKVVDEGGYTLYRWR